MKNATTKLQNRVDGIMSKEGCDEPTNPPVCEPTIGL